MGRPERPLDPEAGPVQRFAFDLRLLREQGGRLSYQELAKRAHYAPTTLSEAAKGEKLPTLEVVRAFVKACGGDQDAWEQRWRELHQQLGRPPPTSPDGTAEAVNGTARPDRPPAAEAVNGAARPERPPGAEAVNGAIRSAPQPGAVLVEPTLAPRRRRPWLAAVCGLVLVALAVAGALWRTEALSPATSRPPRLLPLRQLRALADGGYVRIWALTTDADRAAELTRSARYDLTGALGDCYTRQEPGTVPVWHHTYTFKDDRYQQQLYTIETDPQRDDALTWGWTRHDPRPVCYVYPTPAPGRRPLYRMREGADQTNAVGDTHGHVHTPNREAYRRFGFVIDQVWYLPTDTRQAPEPNQSLEPSRGPGWSSGS